MAEKKSPSKTSHGGKLELASKEVLDARKCVLVETLLGKGGMGVQASAASSDSTKSSGSPSVVTPGKKSPGSSGPSPPPSDETKKATAAKRVPKPIPIKKIGPSAVLGRVKEFLPQLKKSNEALLEKAKTDPNSVSVEAPLQDDHQQHVEVSVALVPNNNEDDTLEDFVTSPTTTLAKQLTAMEVEGNNNPSTSAEGKALIMEMD